MINPANRCDTSGFDFLPPFVADRLTQFERETVRGDRCAHSIVLGLAPGIGDLNLRSNDYLSVGRHPAVLASQIGELGSSGNHQMMSAVFLASNNPQAAMEARFASYIKSEACVIFQSGYQANTGLLQTIAQAGTPIYLDQMAHASLYQGALVSGARVRPFRHNDVDHLDRQAATHGQGIIAVDSVYSTDGSLAPIEDILQVAERRGCVVVVDESHSLGTHGPHGAGLVVEAGLEQRIHFRTASLAKAFCGRAGLVACPARFAHFLRFSSFPSIFSSAILPHELAAFATTLEIVQREEWRREKLHAHSRRLRTGLSNLGYNVAASQSQIIALEAGTETRVVTLAHALQRRGVFGAPFFAPATAQNRACIRLSVHAGLDEMDIRRILEVCAAIRHEVALAAWRSSQRIRLIRRPGGRCAPSSAKRRDSSA